MPREVFEDDATSLVEPTLERLGDREEAELAVAATSSLRPARPRVPKMAVVEGMSHSQIARGTGMPLGTVKSPVRRWMEPVARMLQAGSPEGGQRSRLS